jgi:hypothetical protein
LLGAHVFVEFRADDSRRDQFHIRRYFGAVHYREAFHIDRFNYALGLAALAEKAGARIFEDTPAVSLDPAGVRKRVITPAGRVRSAHVVLAGNINLGPLMPRLAATLLQVTTFVMVTEPLGEILHDIVRYRGAISDTNRADNHYRIVGGDRLQWSGRMRAWEANPRLIARGLVNDVQRTFPGLGKVEVAHLWRGTLGRTVHRMPQIGEIERGVWLASGFGGHGLNNTAVAGEPSRAALSTVIKHGACSPHELVWAGGVLGRALAQGIYWGTRPLERIEQEAARYRSRARAQGCAPCRARETWLINFWIACAYLFSRRAIKAKPLEQMHVLFVLEQRAMEGRNEFLGSRSRGFQGPMSSTIRSLSQSRSSEG